MKCPQLCEGGSLGSQASGSNDGGLACNSCDPRGSPARDKNIVAARSMTIITIIIVRIIIIIIMGRQVSSKAVGILFDPPSGQFSCRERRTDRLFYEGPIHPNTAKTLFLVGVLIGVVGGSGDGRSRWEMFL